MVRFAIIGDIHARFSKLHPVLARIAAATDIDAVLLVGDLGTNDLAFVRNRTPKRDARYFASVEQVLRAVRNLGLPVYYVPGNHDLRELDFEGNIDGVRVELAGQRVVGIGGAGPAHFGFAYEWSDDEIRALELPEADVLLCHCPPGRTPLDLVPRRGEHVGSEAIRERAEAHDGVLICGHIHESPGACRVGDCLCLNVGGLGHPHGRAQVGWVEKDDSGWSVGHEDLQSGECRWWNLDSAPLVSATG